MQLLLGLSLLCSQDHARGSLGLHSGIALWASSLFINSNFNPQEIFETISCVAVAAETCLNAGLEFVTYIVGGVSTCIFSIYQVVELCQPFFALCNIFHPIPGNLQWNFQLLWQHHILPHQHKVPAHPCPHTSVICDPLKTKFQGSSSTCWAEVLFSFAISFQEPFTLPMSAQVMLHQVDFI